MTAVAAVLSGVGLAASLNDTGHTTCHDATGAVISCKAAPAADDARFGRDAASGAGFLKKEGGGLAGFDFTKVANDQTDLPPQATLGKGANNWACTRDNVTGLVWEVKSTDPNDLRYYGNSFTWYETNAAENGGNRPPRVAIRHLRSAQ